MDLEKITDKTIERLCIYRRILRRIEEEGKEIASSKEIGEKADILDTQVRKDLSHFGQFGISGSGYQVNKLRREIDKILGKSKNRRLALVGVGNLGSALLGYPGFKKEGFEIVCAFDKNDEKVGNSHRGVTVYDSQNIKEIIEKKEVDIGIITVPARAAQPVADRLVEVGLNAILNFAPTHLDVPKEVKLQNVDFYLELEVLATSLHSSEIS